MKYEVRMQNPQTGESQTIIIYAKTKQDAKLDSDRITKEMWGGAGQVDKIIRKK